MERNRLIGTVTLHGRGSVRRLHDFCRESLPYSFRTVIADNASADGTAAVGARLADELDAIAYLRLSEKGRGPAQPLLRRPVRFMAAGGALLTAHAEFSEAPCRTISPVAEPDT